MNNYIAVVFDSDEKAYAGLHALWNLDNAGEVTVHGAAVIHRDRFGHIDVATKQTDVGMRTIVGAGIGALIGALAGPVGSAVAGTAAGIGAGTGALAGFAGDAIKAGTHDEAAYESSFVLNPGQSAVIAEVAEEWGTPIDAAMKGLGGRIYRRSQGAVRDTSFFGANYDDYLYPYDYEPAFA